MEFNVRLDFENRIQYAMKKTVVQEVHKQECSTSSNGETRKVPPKTQCQEAQRGEQMSEMTCVVQVSCTWPELSMHIDSTCLNLIKT